MAEQNPLDEYAAAASAALKHDAVQVKNTNAVSYTHLTLPTSDLV